MGWCEQRSAASRDAHSILRIEDFHLFNRKPEPDDTLESATQAGYQAHSAEPDWTGKHMGQTRRSGLATIQTELGGRTRRQFFTNTVALSQKRLALSGQGINRRRPCQRGCWNPIMHHESTIGASGDNSSHARSHIKRHGRFPRPWIPRNWVRQSQSRACSAWRVKPSRRTAIQGISHQRVFAVAEVNSDLVRAARVKRASNSADGLQCAVNLAGQQALHIGFGPLCRTPARPCEHGVDRARWAHQR